MFYVYELSEGGGGVFYVGKGSGGRIHQHEQKARRGIKTHLCNKIRKIIGSGGIILKTVVFETEIETEAFEEEKRRIALYGRERLVNQTDGGDGPSNPSPEVREKIAAGRRGIVISEETRRRLRESHLGKRQSEETKEKIRKAQLGSKHPWAVETAKRYLKTGSKGYKWSEEHRRKFLEKRIGHKVSQETRDKISASKKGSVPWNKKT